MSNQDIALLLEVVKTFREVAGILGSKEAELDSRRFYRSLTALCLLIADVVHNHINTQTLLAHRALDRFQSLTVIDALQTLPTPQTPTSYSHLRAVINYWNRLVDQSESDKLGFVRRHINFGLLPEQRDDLLEFLDTWIDEFSAQYPEDISKRSEDHVVLQKAGKRGPSYGILATTRQLYKTLVESRNCSCEHTHRHDVRLCLRKYQIPGIDKEAELDEEIDFDMFFASQQTWREAQVHTRKECKVKFALHDKLILGRGAVRKSRNNRKRVDKLCEEIEKSRIVFPYHLKFMVEKGMLWKMQSVKSVYMVDTSKAPASLEWYITKRPDALTEKTKRVLAVLLSYSVFHLYGTPWLQSAWGSPNIIFFQTRSSATPLRPFIHTNLVQLDEYNESNNANYDPGKEEPDEGDPDNVLFIHPCPNLVNLAIILLELYLALPFQKLAEKYGVQVSNSASSTDRFFEVGLVFQHCKPDIPEYSGFVVAIDNCLNPGLWQDRDCQVFDEPTLRSVIYQHIVQPLEDELNRAFSYISLEKLDLEAQEIDFANYG